MRIKLIGCASTMNEVRWLGIEDLDCEFLDYSYHARPDKLHKKLQEMIDESQAYDLIILTYNRCSNSVVGLVSAKVPLLFPGTHDCIGLMLGSNERHLKMLQESPLTYYFSQGWLDYGRTPYAEFLEYCEHYGEKKARQLIDALYGRYRRATLIITPGMKDLDHYRTQVRKIADFFDWQVDEVMGDTGLLSSLVKGTQAKGTIYVEPGTPVTLETLKGEEQ